MKVEVLVSVMHQKDHSILEKMNIRTDAIIINQSDENKFETFKFRNKNIKFISLNERGVGLSRNNALMRATGDIVIFADDGIVYCDDYEKKIIDSFNKHKDADMIVCRIEQAHGKRKYIKDGSKIWYHNALKYGTPFFAVKLNKIKSENIYFSLLFGGGAKYCAGEDSLFIYDILKKGFKIYYSNDRIAYDTDSDSTWFKGYNEKYFYDHGALFYHLFGKFAKIVAIIYLVKHFDQAKEIGFKKAYLNIKKGISYEKKI